MAAFEEAQGLEKVARRLVKTVGLVAHVDVDEVLFLRELETRPKALAKCYKVGDHPIGFFTKKKYVIVVYWANADYLSRNQMALLVLHEMMHIPAYGDQLVNHDVQDFRAILGLNLDWSEAGKEVPDILGEKNGKGRKKASVSSNKSRAQAIGSPT